jgi:hypothetical protein
MVGDHGGKLPRMGRGALALHLPAHPQGDQVRIRLARDVNSSFRTAAKLALK